MPSAVRTRPLARRNLRAVELAKPVEQATVLRSGSTRHANLIAVTYHHGTVHCQLCSREVTLLSGKWGCQWTVDGQLIDAPGSWTNVCEETNARAMYIELRRELGGGRWIERQIFLARHDRFVLLADALRGPATPLSEYRMTLPLDSGVLAEPAQEANELTLVTAAGPAARILPLSLPEWRRQPGGSFTAHDILTLQQPVYGPGCHAALFVDLDPTRFKRQLTWRRLTVAESLQTVPRCDAAGYRIQIGGKQWLIYRSLAEIGNRTVLGQNFSSEFVVARFLPNGTADKLLEIG
jgi:hypothetical protein